MAIAFIWFMIGLVAAGALMTVSYVGKQRDPITPGAASVTVLIAALEVAGLVYLLGQV